MGNNSTEGGRGNTAVRDREGEGTTSEVGRWQGNTSFNSSQGRRGLTLGKNIIEGSSGNRRGITVVREGLWRGNTSSRREMCKIC